VSDHIVATTRGRIRGAEAGGVRRFLGVPFAAPPTGSFRLRAPSRPAPWSGVRDALCFGPIAPQPGPAGDSSSHAAFRGLDTHAPGVSQDEDCLTLNIWTAAAGERRPVMVWLHGGGLRAGSPQIPAYDGAEFARQGVVLVTVAYRLGVLGFLCHPALSEGEGACGNWGLLDQLAALAWVRENIAAFGGDPQNVTVFGQSAGASSIAALFALPERRPFDKAILQSAAPKSQTLDEAAVHAEAVAAALGLKDVREVRHAPLSAVLAAQEKVEGGPSAGMMFIVAQDGFLFDKDPLAMLGEGRGVDAPRLVGAVRDEWRRFMPLDPRGANLDEPALRRRLERALPGDPGTIISAYAAHRRARGETASPSEIWFDICGDTYFRLPSLNFELATARYPSATFEYLIDYPVRIDGGRCGSFHSYELPLVFGNWSMPEYAPIYEGMADVAEVSRTLMATWIAFARHGDPSTTFGAWPRWTPSERRQFVLGPNPHVASDPFRSVTDLIAERVTEGQNAAPLGLARR